MRRLRRGLGLLITSLGAALLLLGQVEPQPALTTRLRPSCLAR